MLAANGSIFTILAISFERYYAICKPLKAGYKCTRLRAAIIIGLIWLLATILTSPILIMAKSRETVFMDGTPVYNCVLETDTYWTKMYVFVSMVAFFWLPLLVLMLVYWLIGWKLTRESIALSTTTSLTATDSSLDPTGQASKSAANFRSKLELCDSQKCSLLKSISAFFSSLNHDRYSRFRLSNHSKHLSDNQFSMRAGDYRLEGHRLTGSERLKCTHSDGGRGILTTSKSLCLDDRHPNREILSINDAEKDSVHGAERKLTGLEGGTDFDVRPDISSCWCLLKCDHGDRGEEPAIKGSLVSKFINQLFVPRTHGVRNLNSKAVLGEDISSKSSAVESLKDLSQVHQNIPADSYSSHPLSNGHQATLDDHQPRSWHKGYLGRRPSFARGCVLKASIDTNDHRYSEREPRFKWIKQFSVASSANSVKTNSTMLPSECSLLNSDGYHQRSDIQRSPRPILQNGSSIRTDSCRSSRKKNARFEDTDVIGADMRPDSSLSEENSFSCRSKSTTPDSTQNDSLELRSDIDNCDSIYIKSRNNCQDHVSPSTIDEEKAPSGGILGFRPKLTKFSTTDNPSYQPISNQTTPEASSNDSKKTHNDLYLGEKRSTTGRRSVGSSSSNPDLLSFKRPKRSSQTYLCGHHSPNSHMNDLYVIQDISKKQQMDSRRQVVVMLGFVVACFFMLFFPYRIFTLWLILSSEDQVLSLGMEAYYNLTYFSRILIYLHSAINPIAYNLISTKFRRAFMSILLCQGSSSRRQYTNEHRTIGNKSHSNEDTLRR